MAISMSHFASTWPAFLHESVRYDRSGQVKDEGGEQKEEKEKRHYLHSRFFPERETSNKGRRGKKVMKDQDKDGGEETGAQEHGERIRITSRGHGFPFPGERERERMRGQGKAGE